ncbi:sigma-70 family RNA polymerase sigma factor [Flavivirga aquimarina]|uniref:Sigma-70 family RNA polymerase sigma factor n=1 Tax=Flavivirga aquimarina TaxID=2027862 RepID=A0ABT8WAR7_9FLAO|nr:sigma-70 family RNA polymerase sigma factor [Flavivirga aquimarina]MDO5970243.1 sigma-70 family RNA polymerase sigma factor [Flavivirga aquimarina]
MLTNKQKNTSFLVLFENLYPQLCVFAYKHLNDLVIAKNLVQDVFLNTWDDRISFKDENHATRYFYNTVKNKCLDFIACKQKTNSEPYTHANLEVCQSDAFFMSQPIGIETTAVIENAISKLPNETAKVVKLGIENYTNNEISNELSISVDTVKVHKKSANSKLKKLLGFLTIK